MDDDQDYGAAQPIVDVAKGAYKKANDFLSKIPTLGVKTEDSKPTPDDTHKRMVEEANKSFIHPTQTMAQKKTTAPATTVRTVIKTGPRKRM